MSKPMFVCDVDGVLTDAGVVYSALGHEVTISRKFNVRDGHALEMSRSIIGTVFMSGEDDLCIKARISKIRGIFFGGVSDKLEKTKLLLASNRGIYNGRVIAISDDIMDIPLLKFADVAFCPADAEQAVIKYVKSKKNGIVLKRNGGRGAYREAVNILIGSRRLSRLLTTRP